MSPTAPAYIGWPPAGAVSCPRTCSTAVAIGDGSRPTDAGEASASTVLGGAKPWNGLLKSSATAGVGTRAPVATRAYAATVADRAGLRRMEGHRSGQAAGPR